MASHTASLQSKYFDMVQSGQKTVEGRIFKSKWTKINVGDKITFTNGNRFVDCLCTGVAIYNGLLVNFSASC